MCPFGRCPGMLNGPMTAITPIGLYRVAAVAPACGRSDGFRRSFRASMLIATLPTIASTSVSASQFGLPVWREKQETATSILQYERCCCLLILIKVTGCERSYKRHPLLNKRSPL